MNNFPIATVPDPEDDGFEEPVCQVCYGFLMTQKLVQNHMIWVDCDCQGEDE